MKFKDEFAVIRNGGRAERGDDASISFPVVKSPTENPKDMVGYLQFELMRKMDQASRTSELEGASPLKLVNRHD